MPAPQYSVLADSRYGKRQVVKFGGLPIPIIGSAAGFTDLMDGVNWFLDPKQFGIEVKIDRRLVSTPYLWRAKSQLQSEDYYPCVVTIPILFDESNGTSFQNARAPLYSLGSQLLTFDNATGLTCRLAEIQNLRMRITAQPYLWEGQLKFVGYEPFWKDFASTTQAATNLTGSSGAGTANPFSITYPGNFWAEPVFVLDVPSGNTQAVTQLELKSTTSTEDLIIPFSPSLAPGTHWIITIDCGAMTVTDQNGKQYDFPGSTGFPLLYPPAGQVNSFTATLTALGATTGVTLTPTWTNRWIP